MFIYPPRMAPPPLPPWDLPSKEPSTLPSNNQSSPFFTSFLSHILVTLFPVPSTHLPLSGFSLHSFDSTPNFEGPISLSSPRFQSSTPGQSSTTGQTESIVSAYSSNSNASFILFGNAFLWSTHLLTRP